MDLALFTVLGAEIYRIVSQKTALSPGEMEETIRPSGLEAINVKGGQGPPVVSRRVMYWGKELSMSREDRAHQLCQEGSCIGV